MLNEAEYQNSPIAHSANIGNYSQGSLQGRPTQAGSSAAGKNDLSFLMDLSREMSGLFSKNASRRKVGDQSDKYEELRQMSGSKATKVKIKSGKVVQVQEPKSSNKGSKR